MESSDPSIWLKHVLDNAWNITTLAYRCSETYDKLLELENQFGDKFDLTDEQLALVNLPPIYQDEIFGIIITLLEYKRRLENYRRM